MKAVLRLIKPLFVAFSVITLLSCASLNKENWAAKDYYEEAQEFTEQGSYTLALDNLNELQNLFPYGVYSEHAWLMKAYVFLLFENPLDAQVEISEFLRIYPNHKHSAYALFVSAYSEEVKIKGFIHLYLNNPSKSHMQPMIRAIHKYRNLLRLYPNSKYTPYAKKAIISLINYLSYHELYIAKQYENRSAWVAAINRANYIIERYPESIYTDEALLVMQNSFAELGLMSISEDIKKVYEANKANFSPNN